MKSKTLSWQKTTDRNKLIDSLENGRVSLVTTDTILGLLAPMSVNGHMALNLIKGRTEKPYLVLIGSKDNLTAFIDQEITPEIEKLITVCWPGPLTLIFKGKADVASFAQSKDGTIGIRVPDHYGLQELLKHFKGLFSTSANTAGKPFPKNIDKVEHALLQAVAYIVVDDTPGYELASTLLDCSGSQIKVVREGAYPIKTIEQLIGLNLTKP